LRLSVGPAFIRGEFIKPGATVIDVGVNQLSDPSEIAALFGADAERRREAIEKRGYTLIGDVHPAEADSVLAAEPRYRAGSGCLPWPC
jgi:methylenetetrahydrofolate dehydrogenase (NADP+)/methenyltetrahydrofolate cyclohydrolase